LVSALRGSLTEISFVLPLFEVEVGVAELERLDRSTSPERRRAGIETRHRPSSLMSLM